MNSYKHNSSPSKVFLTGITGLLGAFLCHEILQTTSAVVYCLVRAESKSLAFKRIQDNLHKYNLWKRGYKSRIIPVLGDLTEAQLGIKTELYNELSQSIEMIYHCGAFVNHLLNYHSLKAANVDGTLSIIEFAGNIQVKPILFISSIGVLFRVDGDAILPIHKPETGIDDGKYLIDGYAQTKWVSEHHLLQAQENDIPITILRCGQITGSSLTGYGIAQDLFHSFLKVFSEIRVVPQRNDLVIDFVPIDYVCRVILTLSLQNNCFGKIYHLSPNPIPIQEFFDFLQKKKPSISKVSYKEWADCCLQHVRNLSESTMKSMLLQWFDNASEHRMFEMFFNNWEFVNNNIQEILQSNEVRFPEIDENWWEKCMLQLTGGY